MTAATDTDRALVDRVAKGDRAAVRLLFMRHHARVYRFVARQTGSEMMADDIWTLRSGERIAIGANQGKDDIRLGAYAEDQRIVLRMTKSEVAQVIGLLVETLIT